MRATTVFTGNTSKTFGAIAQARQRGGGSTATANTPVRKDWFVLGFLTGAASSVAKTATNAILAKSGLPTQCYGIMATSAILGKKTILGGRIENPPKTPSEWAIGYTTDALMGGLFGAGMSYVLAKTPPGNEFFKGAVGGAALWAGTQMIGRQLQLSGFVPARACEMATLLAVNTLFGGLTGLALGRWGASVVEQSHPILVKETSNREFHKGRLSRSQAEAR